MSAEIINLRMVRKQKNRQDKEKTAEDNRRKYGRSKAEREAARTATRKTRCLRQSGSGP